MRLKPPFVKLGRWSALGASAGIAMLLAASACGDDGAVTGSTAAGGSGASGGGSAGGGGQGPVNMPPTAQFNVVRDTPLTVSFDASASMDPDGTIVSYSWDFGDGTNADGMQVEHVYDAAGCFEVKLVVVDDGDLDDTANRVTRVLANVAGDASDFALEGVPREGALLPRDLETNAGTLTLHGQADQVDYESLVVRVYNGSELEHEGEVDLCEDATLVAPVTAELASKTVEVYLRGLGSELPLATANDIVAGDVYLVNGQSNAVASEFNGSADENLSPFVRSFGSRTENATAHQADDAWHQAASTGSQGAVGQWPLRMAAELSTRFGLPIAVINGARGGVPIAYFERNDLDKTDVSTNYGRLLDRAQRAGVTDRVRAILFYQGESDGTQATTHHDGFVQLFNNWGEDFADVEHHYVTQIRRGCGGAVETRDVQRRFAGELDRTSVMSTTGLDGHDGCHFAYADGYRELGDWYANLLARDLYDATAADVDAVDVGTATLNGDSIVITTTGDATALTVDAGVEAYFEARGGNRAVIGVQANGTELLLQLGPGNSDPTEVAFIGHPQAGPWVTNAAGVGLLAFLIPVE